MASTANPIKRAEPAATEESGGVVVDLFCGVGGFSLGAARAGFRVKAAVDLDPHAISAHAINFPKTIHLEEDARTLSGASIRKVLNEAPLLGVIGGPPCQGFSSMGSNNLKDPRSQLFVQFFRLISELQPKFFLAENVPGIMGPRYDGLRKRAFAQVGSNYTVLAPMLLHANAFGAPTIRKRVFFFGYRKDVSLPITEKDFAPSPKIKPVTVRDALRGLPTTINPHWRTEQQGWRVVKKPFDTDFGARAQGRIPPQVGDSRSIARLATEHRASGFWGTIHESNVIARFKKVPQGKTDSISRCIRLNAKGYCPTLRAGTGPDRGSFQAVRPLHPTADRVITPREAARLQGFPDWFQFTPTRWHSFRQIGNSVSPIVAEHVLSAIRKALNKEVRLRRNAR